MILQRLNKTIVLTISLVFASIPLSADVKLPSVFSNDMVLQQNTNARFWGHADPQEKVTIHTSWGETLDISADGKGKWSAEIPTPAGSYTPQQVIFKGATNTIYLKNVLIGEVWLCSGQSNMGWPLRKANDSYDEIKNANNPFIRFFHIPLTMAWEPQEDVGAKWERCTPETAAR